jgi:hypothetical protein
MGMPYEPFAGTLSRDGATTVPAISLVVTTHGDLHEVPCLLDRLQPGLRDGDELILLSGVDATPIAAQRPWLRIVDYAGASSFTLRAQLPVVCGGDWIILIEDHSPITCAAIDKVRAIVREDPDLDMIVVLAKNLTSTEPWGWANFLFTFFQLWAPVTSLPPMAAVTSTIVRRERLGNVPLAEGEWELKTIPQIFAGGRTTYSNDIFVDHIRHLGAWSAAIIAFCNARVGASLQRRFGIPLSNVVREGWHCIAQRPGMIATALVHRRSELPPGTFWRLRVIGVAHMIGNLIGYCFGAGRAARIL